MVNVPDVPEIGLTITRTAKGDYHAIVYHCEKVNDTMRVQLMDTFTSKKLPDFMWQLAKRIMPK